MTHMTHKRIVLAAIAVGFLALFSIMTTVRANPFYFPASVATSAATTTPAYLAIGTATSTLTFDSYAQGQTKATDKGVLLVQAVASSTSSVYLFTFQYSQDGIDWYSDNTQPATTTSTVVTAPQVFTFTAAGTATSSRAIPVSFPTRYVRVVTSITGAAGAVWQQIVPQRQSN